MNAFSVTFKALILTIAIALTGCGTSKPDGGYRLVVELKNYKSSTIERQIKNKSTGELISDTIQVKNGKFTLMGKLEKAQEVFFQSTEPDSYDVFNFWLDNNEVNVTVDFTKYQFDDKTGELKYPDWLIVSGSKAQDLLDKYNAVEKEATERFDGSYGHEAQEYKFKEILKIAEQNPKNPVTKVKLGNTLLGANAGNAPIDIFEKYLDILLKSFKNSEEYSRISQFIEIAKKRAPGSSFIDYVANDPDGKEVKLANLLGKSYVFVDLWASWCGPCRAENPNYKKAYSLYKDKGFKVLSVSFDSRLKNWKKAIQDDELFDFVHASELNNYNNQVAKAYGITGIPDNFLLDKDGKIVGNNLKGEELLEFLEGLYEKS